MMIEKDEEGWLISEVVELPGCHTQARDLNELTERTKEAIKAYLKDSKEPEITEKFVGIQQLEV